MAATRAMKNAFSVLSEEDLILRKHERQAKRMLRKQQQKEDRENAQREKMRGGMSGRWADISDEDFFNDTTLGTPNSKICNFKDHHEDSDAFYSSPEISASEDESEVDKKDGINESEESDQCESDVISSEPNESQLKYEASKSPQRNSLKPCPMSRKNKQLKKQQELEDIDAMLKYLTVNATDQDESMSQSPHERASNNSSSHVNDENSEINPNEIEAKDSSKKKKKKKKSAHHESDLQSHDLSFQRNAEQAARAKALQLRQKNTKKLSAAEEARRIAAAVEEEKKKNAKKEKKPKLYFAKNSA